MPFVWFVGRRLARRKEKNSVEMVRHHNEVIEKNVLEMVGKVKPSAGDSISNLFGYEHHPPSVCANSYEIRASPRVIVAVQSDGTATGKDDILSCLI